MFKAMLVVMVLLVDPNGQSLDEYREFYFKNGADCMMHQEDLKDLVVKQWESSGYEVPESVSTCQDIQGSANKLIIH